MVSAIILYCPPQLRLSCKEQLIHTSTCQTADKVLYQLMSGVQAEFPPKGLRLSLAVDDSPEGYW